ncbi:MAG: DUF4810 domain-containing protein [Rikenellaceae bacterium]|jgi:hypothetical protein|nr:DUF4810 domain-containing protein [Rikenellaceae bacterium]
MKKLLLPLVVAVFAASCATTSPALYDWKGYDDAVYTYIKTADAQSMENLMTVYAKLMTSTAGARKVPPPGMCADYGYLLLKQGKTAEGKDLLTKETMLYPESKPFVDRLLKRFE